MVHLLCFHAKSDTLIALKNILYKQSFGLAEIVLQL